MQINWQPIFKARSSLLFQWYVAEGHREKYFRSSLNLDTGLANHKIVSDEIFTDRDEWAKLEEVLTSKVKAESGFFKEFIQLCYRYSDRLIQTATQVGQTKDLSNLTNADLLPLYKKYRNAVLDLMPFLNCTLVMDNVLKEEIAARLKDDLGIEDENKQDLLLNKLVIPKKKNFFVQETEDLLEIALKLQEDKKANIEQDVKEYLEKYVWMPSVAYLGPFLTKADVVEKAKNLLKENPKERLGQIEKTKKETQEDYEKALDQIKKSQKLIELIDLAREFIYLRTYRFDVFSIAHYHVHPLLEKIGERFSLQVEEIVYLTGEEIISLLEGKTGVGKEEIKSRISNYALIKEGNEYTILSGNAVGKVAEKVVEETLVKGMVASRGRAIGKAKFANEVEDIPKVNEGDIIVSPMTRPILLPAMTKAAGIITDFGGILCHAAIVSREFGIPCIVGTKNATKVFKDGDLVELNAYAGTARKLYPQTLASCRPKPLNPALQILDSLLLSPTTYQTRSEWLTSPLFPHLA